MLFVRDRFDVQHLPLFERGPKEKQGNKKRIVLFFLGWTSAGNHQGERNRGEREMGGSKRKGRDSGLSVRKSNLTLASRSRIDSLLY